MSIHSKFDKRLWVPAGLLLISAALYAVLLYVRTLQAWKWFGDIVDLSPVAATIRTLGPLADARPEQLRWISYVIFVSLAVLYCLALWISARGSAETHHGLRADYITWVIVPYVVLGLVSLVLYPHYSRPVDTVDYTMQARVQLVYGANPYLVAGGAYADRDQLSQHMEAKQRPSVYGPVWQVLSFVPSVAGGGRLVASIVVMKLWFFLAGLLCLWFLWVFYTRSVQPGERRWLTSGVLLAWNPALHLISHGEGHNDIWMAVFLAGALVLLAIKRPLFAFVAWSLSVLVKFISAPLAIALMTITYATQASLNFATKLKLIVAGLALSGLVAVLTIWPFGVAAVLGSVSGRYGGLLASGGDSKISLVAGLLSRVLGLAGIHTSPLNMASLVGLLLPLSWLGYGLVRGLSARDVEGMAKVALEMFLFYLTFVAIPVYAQYVVTPIVLAAFIRKGVWHQIAALVASVALVWDSLFLVYLPPAYPAWEGYLHQLSHVAVFAIVLLYLAMKLGALIKPRFSPAVVNTQQ